MNDLRIGFIGWGSMAEAMIRGSLQAGIVQRENVAATGTRKERAEELQRLYDIYVSTENTSILDCIDVLVLAVKPQMAPRIFKEVHGKVPSSVLVVSVMAGISIDQLKTGLGTDNVVRCMPNTPAKIGVGFTGWTAADEVAPADREIARKIFASLGEEKYFAQEHLLHAVTAGAATAVAFVCEFIDALIGALVYLGVSWRDARAMVLQVIKGTVALIEASSHHPAVLRDEVTSPDGTTTRGLRALQEGRFRFTVLEAVRSAYDKSVEMGNKK